DAHYVNAMDLLVIPSGLAFVLAFGMPWLLLLVVNAQEEAVFRRKANTLKRQTAFLKSSVAQAEAQARLNGILAQDETIRRERQDLERMRKEVEEQKQAAEQNIATSENELELKRQEYERLADKGN